MTFEIGETAIGLLTVMADMSDFKNRGGRLDGIRIHGRDDRSGSEETGISWGDGTVDDLGKSGEDRAMRIVHTRKGIVVIVIVVFAHAQRRIFVIAGAVCVQSSQEAVVIAEVMSIVDG